MPIEQLPLFPGDQPTTGHEAPTTPYAGLTDKSPLTIALDSFRDHMIGQEYTDNTVKSFLGDLSLFQRFLRADVAIDQISTKTLQDFMHWLERERGTPCSPKSYARRLTTLKVFFSWLAESGILHADPAAPLVHKPAQAPLPTILYDEQVNQILSVTRQLLVAEKPDSRPHLLVTLLLHTGIKKQECMAIKLSHISTLDPAGPVIHIRYDSPRMQHKERRLRLPQDWSRTLGQYLGEYEPQESLFPCTARNLEYVLTDLAKLANLADGLSFEMLRWTCAVRDYQARLDPERLRRKLGLSQMSWKETEAKIIRLAEPPL
jgi:site-specific recombinase XerD